MPNKGGVLAHSSGLRSCRRGFTLLEVLVALAILGIGLLGSLAMMARALHGSGEARHLSKAAQIARDQMETFQRLSWTDPQLQPTAWTAPLVVTDLVTSPTGVEGLNYNLRWRITDDPADPDLRLIDVQVFWQESNRAGTAPRQFSISGIVRNPT